MLKEEQANGASCLANYVAGLDFTILKSSVSLSVLERAAVSRRYSVNVVDLLLLATQIINLPLHGTVTRRIGVAGYITGNCSVTVPDVTLPRSLFQTRLYLLHPWSRPASVQSSCFL